MARRHVKENVIIHLRIIAEQHALELAKTVRVAINKPVQVTQFPMFSLFHTNVLCCEYVYKYKFKSITLFPFTYTLVDGQWGCWAAWTTCTNSCGGGKRTRERKCNNPPADHGGATCSGIPLESDLNCNENTCPGR